MRKLSILAAFALLVVGLVLVVMAAMAQIGAQQSGGFTI